MEDLIINGDKQKPDLVFSAMTGKLNISGQSLPENALLLYNPVLEWLDKYAKNPSKQTIFSLQMKYYNTASSKMFFSMMKKLNTLYTAGHDIEVKWHYSEDDEDMLDAGEYLRDLVDIPFHFISS